MCCPRGLLEVCRRRQASGIGQQDKQKLIGLSCLVHTDDFHRSTFCACPNAFEHA